MYTAIQAILLYCYTAIQAIIHCCTGGAAAAHFSLSFVKGGNGAETCRIQQLKTTDTEAENKLDT